MTGFLFAFFSLPDSIGKIWKVQIWHNNFGSSPSWYLSRVIVKDLNNGKVYRIFVLDYVFHIIFYSNKNASTKP